MLDVGTLGFFALAALTVGSGLVVALSRNIIYSTMALLGTFLGVAGIYVSLSADFLGVVQLLVYVGGTLTLILFAVMLTAKMEEVRTSNSPVGLVPFLTAATLVGALVGVLALTGITTEWPAVARAQTPATARLGHAFLNAYLLPFELASIVLLAALVGAVVLARRAVRGDAGEETPAAAKAPR